MLIFLLLSWCIMKNNTHLSYFPVHKSLPAITLSETNQLLKEGEEFEVTCTILDVDSTLKADWIFRGNAVSQSLLTSVFTNGSQSLLLQRRNHL